MFDNLTMVVKDLKVLESNQLLFYILSIYTLRAVYTDLSSLKITDNLNKTFLLLRIVAGVVSAALATYAGINIGLEITMDNVFGLAVGGLLVLIPAMIKMKPMGGDIKFCAVLGFWLGYEGIIAALIMGVLMFWVLAALSGEMRKMMNIPFAPFIAIGYGLSMLTVSVL